MDILYPEYGNCIANLACSVMKYFGADAPNNTLPLADKLLDREYKNVVVILLDAMGKNIMDKNLDPEGFFGRHLAGCYSSTFPPTTVAATTAALSGLYPNQSAWLGWEGYFPEIDKNVVYYLNTDNNGEPAADYNVAYRYCPYESIFDRMEKAGAKAYGVTPFDPPNPQDFEAICTRIEELCMSPERKYIYAYWTEPDTSMHLTGCHSEQSVNILRDLEKRVETLSEKLSDALLIITADHGHIDSKNAVITDYEDIMECLERLPSIEPRALNLFVKKGMEKTFEERFMAAFGDKFLLMTKKEVLEKQLFGTGENSPRIDIMLGDYLGLAVSDMSIFNSGKETVNIGMHAGLTRDEMIIPLIAVKCGLDR